MLKTGPSSAIGSYSFTGGVVLATVFVPVVLVCEYGAMVGSSFAGDDLATSLTYWTWIVAISVPLVPYVFMVLAASLGRVGLATGGMVLYAIALAWQCWVILYGMLMWADCEGDIHCADNLSYVGVVTGPYDGASVRFVFVFVATIFMAIAECISIGVLFAARRKMMLVFSGADMTRGVFLTHESMYGAEERQRRKFMRSAITDGTTDVEPTDASDARSSPYVGAPFGDDGYWHSPPSMYEMILNGRAT